MPDHRSPLAKARDEWLESAEGQKCADGSASGQYLKNRLERAFIAGAQAQWNVPIALFDVLGELQEARAKFPPMNSAHEGYAVILEELDELFEVIRSKKRTNEELRAEAKQVAAMALRFMIDVCDGKGI